MPDNAAQAPVISARVKEPRVLGNKETRDNLDHWLDQFKAYWKKDDRSRIFLQAGTTWNPKSQNYGFGNEAPGSQLKRTAAELESDLLDFLDNFAGYLPFRYLTQKLKSTTGSFKDVRNALYEIYGVQNSASTLLDFASMRKSPDETYRQFFERLASHVEGHIPVPGGDGIVVQGVKIEPAGEPVTVALLNQVVISWLQAIDPRLIGLVQVAYSKDLKKKNEAQGQIILAFH